MAPKTKSIVPLADDPEYAREARVLRLLEDGLAGVEHAVDRFELELHFARAGLSSGGREKQGLARLKELRKTTKPAPVPAGVSSATAAVERGLARLRGERSGLPDDWRARLAEAREDREILGAAVGAQQEICDRIKALKSAELAERLRDRHREIVLRLFRGLQEVAAAADVERAFFGELLVAGYDYRFDVLPRPTVPAVSMLGSETAHESQISSFRRLLEELQIL